MSSTDPQAAPPPPPPLRPCPRCGPFAELQQQQGALHEAICPRCLGRFLPSHARELMLAELSIDDALLREMLDTFAGEKLSCPGCGFRTTEIRLRGRTAGMCTGCGGMWLDQGELSRVTEESVREVGVTERAPEELPTPPPRFAHKRRRREARFYGEVQVSLFLVWAAALAAVSFWFDRIGLEAGRRVLYFLLGTSAYYAWFLPTMIAKRKKRFLRIFAGNVAALLLPPAWLYVAGKAVVAADLDEPEKLSPKGARSTRELGAGPDQKTAPDPPDPAGS